MVQHGRHLLVDAGVAEMTLGHHAVGVTEDHGDELHRVDAEVEQRAAAERQVEQAVGRVEVAPEAEVGLDEAGVADAALRQQVAEDAVGRQEPAPHRLHQEDALGPGVGDHRHPLQPVEGERLLAQDVLAGGQQQARVPFVDRVR